jgi:hypothetical protein
MEGELSNSVAATILAHLNDGSSVGIGEVNFPFVDFPCGFTIWGVVSENISSDLYTIGYIYPNNSRRLVHTNGESIVSGNALYTKVN